MKKKFFIVTVDYDYIKEKHNLFGRIFFEYYDEQLKHYRDICSILNNKSIDSKLKLSLVEYYKIQNDIKATIERIK